MIKLNDALIGISSLGFDTAPIIYFVEANPAYDAIVTSLFSKVESGTITGITSIISLCEVIVLPFRNRHNELQEQYRKILLESSHFYMQNINPTIAETAAQLRANYDLRTPDTLQVATALENGCDAFLCNDKNLKRVKQLRVLILDELSL